MLNEQNDNLYLKTKLIDYNQLAPLTDTVDELGEGVFFAMVYSYGHSEYEAPTTTSHYYLQIYSTSSAYKKIIATKITGSGTYIKSKNNGTWDSTWTEIIS